MVGRFPPTPSWPLSTPFSITLTLVARQLLFLYSRSLHDLDRFFPCLSFGGGPSARLPSLLFLFYPPTISGFPFLYSSAPLCCSVVSVPGRGLFSNFFLFRPGHKAVRVLPATPVAHVLLFLFFAPSSYACSFVFHCSGSFFSCFETRFPPWFYPAPFRLTVRSFLRSGLSLIFFPPPVGQSFDLVFLSYPFF